MSEKLMPTPRTDALIDAQNETDVGLSEGWHQLRDLARQLERELAEAQQKRDEYSAQLDEALSTGAKLAVSASTERLWLWKNFVDGRPEYWAFDNPYPCRDNGDPMTLGEPCGYAIPFPSNRGRNDVSDDEVIAAIKRASARSSTAQPEAGALDSQRIDWLYHQHKHRLAMAFDWPYIPDSPYGLRAKLDEMARSASAAQEKPGG